MWRSAVKRVDIDIYSVLRLDAGVDHGLHLVPRGIFSMRIIGPLHVRTIALVFVIDPHGFLSWGTIRRTVLGFDTMITDEAGRVPI